MDKLEVLNDVAMKQASGLTVPLSLKISLKGKWHTVTVDRDDKDVQRLVRVLVSMMMRSEIARTGKLVEDCESTLANAEEVNTSLKDYKVSVITEMRESTEDVPFGGIRSPDYPVSETVKVRAHTPLDARVMAFILVADVPDDSTPTWLIEMAREWTEVMP